ncbi:WXG100 family type VII secretion target [Cellulomonas pakistanensis]|uniref:Uncharacterized protein n=1 Tax=Cellulomonas pakistanensis TaxID=992287 RepID=A0A919PCR0_9CELL|nr:hypothetical protein [Cellulomonas pakistanensis]GIG36217.1 hypothetical protein Cpa01nite_15980 [Cellulomonas pakistanensis]
MAALTLEVVRSWRPEALSDAATGVGTAQEAVDAQVRAAKAAMTRLGDHWQGDAAQAAAQRMATEATTGFALADALESAKTALSSGATDLGRAKSAVLSTVDAATAAGFTVAGDGRVTAPTLPPVMTAAGDPDGAGAARAAQQRALNEDAQVHADAISTALGDVATTDQQVADRLAKVEVPQSLVSAVDAYLQRAFSSGDFIGALGSVGAGAVALAQVIKGVMKSVTKGKAYLDFLKASSAPITHYAAMVENFKKADAAMDVFRNGKPAAEWMTKLLGQQGAGAMRTLGKAFLPLTVVTGLADTVTGGGYDGARGWATRGFGLAGAAGAGTLIAVGTGALALGPVGLAVAGGAVLAYGAWSVGNLIWDNREAIGDFFQSAGGVIADGWNATTGAVSNAVSDAADWAGDQVDKAKDAVADFGKGALNVLSGGLW